MNTIENQVNTKIQNINAFLADVLGAENYSSFVIDVFYLKPITTKPKAIWDASIYTQGYIENYIHKNK